MRKITIQEYIYVLMSMFVLVGATIFPNFATDTYATFSHPDYSAMDMLTRNGRPVTALIYKLSIMMNITDVTLIGVYTILGFVCLFFAIVLYEDSLKNYINNDLFRCLLATLALCNVYIIEYFMFLEKVAFLLTILCCVVAYRNTKKVIENSSSNKIIDIAISFVFLVISACTYQPTLSLFVVLLLPIILKIQRLFIDKLKWLALTALMYGGAGIVDLLILKIIGSSRVANNNSVSEKIIAFISLPLNSIKSFGIIPKGFWLGTVCVIIVICFLVVKKGDRINTLFHISLVFLGTELCALSTIILGVGWFGARVIYVFACLPMMIIVFAFVSDIFKDQKEYTFSPIIKILMTIIALNIIITSIGFNNIYKDKYITNALDEYRCKMIGQAISYYEEETGITVNKVVYYEDQHLDSYERMFTSNPSFRVSSFDTDWSDINALNYYLGRTFERGEIDKSIEEQFLLEDWTVYSEEQLKFDGDTLHICRY